MRWLRVAGWLLLAWWTLRAGFLGRWIFLDFVNLAFHEAGHVFLSFAGNTLHSLGGTLGQLLVPGLLVARFLRRNQPVGAAFCLWWLGENFFQIAIYMADARELALPLVGGGDHDWNEIFFRFGLLGEESVRHIAATTRAIGFAVSALGLAWLACLALPEESGLRARLARGHSWLEEGR